MDKCYYCNGLGEVTCEGNAVVIGKYEHPADCPSCGGNCNIPCPVCQGTGLEEN